jgi:hypothetical protein
MDNTQTNLRTTMSPHKLSVNDEMSASITNAIDHLASDGTFLTRMRLRGARSREALKLAETALKESMAAKNRTFVVAVGLAEDLARKLLLSDSMRNTEAVEREITQTINDALRNFERLITERELAAYTIELERIGEAQAMRDASKLSDRRFEQLVTSIEESTDKIVAGVHETTREILGNLRNRFNAALRQSGGAA